LLDPWVDLWLSRTLRSLSQNHAGGVDSEGLAVKGKHGEYTFTG
jgi:hypothetical protein